MFKLYLQSDQFSKSPLLPPQYKPTLSIFWFTIVVLTDLPALAFLLLQLIFCTSQEILLKLYVRSSHSFPQNLLMASRPTLSQSQNPYYKQQDLTGSITPSPSAFSLNPSPVSLPFLASCQVQWSPFYLSNK